MRVIRSVRTMQARALQLKARHKRIAFVPTMGYLHEGHLSLIRRARRAVGNSGVIVVSIYVNPTQFGPGEDFDRYPRDLRRDLKLCRAEKVDIVFTPTDAQMYPGRDRGLFSTYVVEETLSAVMEGAVRPGHFKGVTTVVAKLFNIVQPDVAVFGAKDWQQAVVIKRMIQNLNFPVKLLIAPTVREPDGLAMSSRNSYLSQAHRARANILYRAIEQARIKVRTGPQQPDTLRNELRQFILGAVPDAQIDYIEFFQSETLQPVPLVRRGTHMALAVRIGGTRLIDNARL